MENTNLIILISIVLLIGTINSFDPINPNTNEQIKKNIDLDECAGIIAVGSVVKDGRSIFWKNRHMAGSENNKPRFMSGAIYDFYGIGDCATCTFMGMNEVGLAMGNFVSTTTPLSSWTHTTDCSLDQTSGIMNYLLGHFDTVVEAAEYAGNHMCGNSQLGIISSEPNIGAIVTVGKNSAGDNVCKVDYITNGYAAVANGNYANGQHDADQNDIYVINMIEDILLNGGINGDYKIDWEEIVQRGAKHVSNREKGTGDFSTVSQISRSTAPSSLVAVSGYGNPAIHIGWIATGRQPLVGTFVPLSASYLQSSSDIPTQLSNGGGIEDYYDAKVTYACYNQGSDTCNAERVREVQTYTNNNEKWMFEEYGKLNFSGKSSTEIKTTLSNFVDITVPTIINNYANGDLIETLTYPPLPENNIIDNGNPGTIPLGIWEESEGSEEYMGSSFFSTTSDTENSYSWTATLPSNGKYEVSMWWSYTTSRHPSTPIEIYDEESLVWSSTVNQLQNYGQWNLLSSIDFSTNKIKITIKDDSTIYSVAADAVNITKVNEETTCVHEADLEPCDGKINRTELNNYLNVWKGNPNANLFDAIKTIGVWKS